MIFEASFEFETKYFPRTVTSQKTYLLGTFGTITLGVYNLLRNGLIHKSMKFKRIVFIMIVFKWSISKWNVLKSQHLLKLLWRKSPLLVRWKKGFIIGENSTKCWFSINNSDKFTNFTTNFDVYKRKWATIFLFNGEVYVLMFKGHIFAKRLGRLKWFKKYKSIINIPFTKTWFRFYRTFIQQVFFTIWKENVSQYWT